MRIVAKTESLPTNTAVSKIMTTIVNAQSVAAGSNTGAVNLGLDGTEDEVWLAINIDKQPWSLYMKTIFGVATTDSANYPAFIDSTSIYAGLEQPALCLVLGRETASLLSMSEAKAQRLPLDNTITCTVYNKHATDVATIKIRVLRVWR